MGDLELKRILVADDEPDILKIVEFRLKKNGYEVITAVNGQEALDTARREIPDLILLDIAMPLIPGDKLSQMIKADADIKHIPVILMTASTQMISTESIRKLGVQGFILKPFEPEELLETIRKGSI